MTRDELIMLLHVERYGPRPRRCETRQEPVELVRHYTDTPAAQKRRRAELAAAIDDRDETREASV